MSESNGMKMIKAECSFADMIAILNRHYSREYVANNQQWLKLVCQTFSDFRLQMEETMFVRIFNPENGFAAIMEVLLGLRCGVPLSEYEALLESSSFGVAKSAVVRNQWFTGFRKDMELIEKNREAYDTGMQMQIDMIKKMSEAQKSAWDVTFRLIKEANEKAESEKKKAQDAWTDLMQENSGLKEENARLSTWMEVYRNQKTQLQPVPKPEGKPAAEEEKRSRFQRKNRSKSIADCNEMVSILCMKEVDDQQAEALLEAYTMGIPLDKIREVAQANLSVDRIRMTFQIGGLAQRNGGS